MWRDFRENILFAWKYVCHPLRNASVTPSSARAAEAMVAGIDFSDIHTIFELGPGTGVFTKRILKYCRQDTKVVLVEIDPKYAALLQERFGDRVLVEQTSVADLEALVAKHGGKVDLIISGLPVVIPGVTEKLLRVIKKCTDEGTIYRFFSYVPFLVRQVYKGLPVRKVSPCVLLNVPPLWVFEMH